MKPILYVGAALMVGASIYGFVDYKKASQKRDFADMYEATENPREVLPLRETSITKEPVTEIKTGTAKKSVVTIKKTPEMENVSEEINESFFIDEIEAVEKIAIEKSEVKEPELKENAAIKIYNSVKKKKKLDHKLFSRAPLDESYLEKELKLEEIKLEPKKTVQKGSIGEKKKQ
jgi:hypothetical protein